MAEKLGDKEIQAVAVLSLLDTGNEDMANALLACKLTLHFYSAIEGLEYLDIEGREANLRKLRPHPGDFPGVAVNTATHLALEGAFPKSIRVYNQVSTIRLRAVLNVPASYQDDVRKLIESARVDEPALSVLRVRREGREYQLRPISIFPVGTFERDAKLCFVLMPFAPGFQPIYEQGIKPAIEAQSLTCQRGDDILQAGDIIGQIWGSLIKARLVVADLTGANGNVLYELGLAHMMGHQAILLAQDISSVPFDLRQQRHIIYSPSESGLQKLTTALAQAIQAMIAQ